MLKRILLPALLAASAASAASAQSPTVLVLDASGSMWAELPDGKRRVEVARTVLSDFLTARDPARPLGVVAYGHNRRGDCADIETLTPVGLQDGVALAERLRRINPKGKTPLTNALRRAAAMIPREAEEADLVLITDGLETCGGDPCALAAELAASGIRLRTHVVGFGLTEGEVRQMACLPDATGGLLLNTASGAELSEALGRTAERPVVSEPTAPGRASLNLTIRASNAGRPQAVRFLATGADGTERDLGLLVFDGTRTGLPVELEEGAWRIRATTEGQGEGAAEIEVAAGDVRTIYVPFSGLYPSVTMENRGPYEAGISAAVPYEITDEGLAVGGADYLISLLPLAERDRAVGSPYERERVTWHYQSGRRGAYVARVSMPAETGRYLMSFHRDGDDPVTHALVLKQIEVSAEPAILIDAPPAAQPGEALPVTIRGGQNTSDIIEIQRDGASVDRWNPQRSTYLREVLAGNALVAPDEDGLYEIVYLRSNAPDGARVAARLPLEVGRGDVLAEVPAAAGDGADDAAEAAAAGDGSIGTAWSDYPFACLFEAICEFRDPVTGLAFSLPQGWVAFAPSLSAMTAGAAAAGEVAPYLEFAEAGGNLNQMVLNPRQWVEANGACATTRAGDLCLLRNDAAPDDPDALAALQLVQASLTRGEVLRRCDDAPCDFAQRNPPFAGRMPPAWSVEVARLLPDGRRATWFFDTDPAGNFKLIGLNQTGGEACRKNPAGDLCEFTPYISTDEAALIGESVQ